METYILIKFHDEIEKQADASNDIRVHYKTPKMEILGKGSLQEMLDKLETIKSDRDTYQQYREGFHNIINKRPKGKRRTEHKNLGEYDLMEKWMKETKESLKAFGMPDFSYTSDPYLFKEHILQQIEQLRGDYLIIPAMLTTIK